MTGMRRAIKLFLLIVVLELMLFSHTESWRRCRRRRRRYVPLATLHCRMLLLNGQTSGTSPLPLNALSVSFNNLSSLGFSR